MRVCPCCLFAGKTDAGQPWSSASEDVTFSITPECEGGKSLTLAIEARHGDEVRVGARRVLVFTSLDTYRAINMPADVRAALQERRA